jgi:outer membrane receptor protein involved in Fe transport
VDDTFVFSPSLVASFRAGLLSYTSRSTGGAYGSDPADLGIPEIVARNQAFAGWSNFSLGENLPGIGSSYSFSRDMIFSALTTWTKLAGRHGLKFGADYRLGRINSISPGGNAPGTFTVSPNFTQSNPFNRNTQETSRTAMASILLGLADSGSFGSNTPTSIQNHYIGLFLQDDWKVSSRLTLNFGLRYELETPFTERYDRMSLRFDEDAQLPAAVPGLDLRGGTSSPAAVIRGARASTPTTSGRGSGSLSALPPRPCSAADTGSSTAWCR